MDVATPDRPGAGSGPQHDGSAELAPRKASRPIPRHEIEEGVDAHEPPTVHRFVSGLSARLDLGFAGHHHVNLGSVEVLAGAFAGQEVSAADVGRFPLWATLGKTAGGVVFVAILKYGLARPESQADSAEAR